MCETLHELRTELIEPNSESIDDLFVAAQPTLCDLPVEIVLKICSFLEADFIKQSLSKVCKRFEEILTDDVIWRVLIKAKIGKSHFPVLQNLKIWQETEVDWEGAGIDMCKEYKKWTNVEETMRHIVVKDVHFASVDTVLLVNNGQLCVSGGRDRGMALWRTLSISPHDQSHNVTTISGTKPEHMRLNAHAGWVWDLAADNIENATKIYSASWDNSVKEWDLEAGFTSVNQFNCGMSALSLVYRDNLLLTGLYSKMVVIFDSRAGKNPLNMYKAHKGPVLALESYGNLVASVSEDRTLAVWDIVAGKLIASGVSMHIQDAYPVCINWTPAALYVGDSRGFLHLINPETIRHTKTHTVWSQPETPKPYYKITGCHQSLGCMIVSSDRGEIKFFYNADPPIEFTTVKTSTCDITQLRYQNGVLAVGTCDSALEFWVPAEMYDED